MRLASTLAALTFLDSWNNFLWPLIAITSRNQMTLPLGLAAFQGAHQTEWTLLMARQRDEPGPHAAASSSWPSVISSVRWPPPGWLGREPAWTTEMRNQ